MIHFSAGLLLSVGQSSTLTVKIKDTCIQGVSQSEVYPGSAGSASRECWIGSRISLKGVQILQRMAPMVNFTYDFTEIPMKMIFSLNWGSSEPVGGGVRGNSIKPLWNRDRSVTLKYCQGVPQSK